MTKYNEEVLNAAESSVAEGFDHYRPDRWVAQAVFDTLTRAPWWEEVAGDYGVEFGEPFREECAGRAWEHSNEGPYRPISSFAHEGSLFRYFRDTRWTPPAPPLAVGDVIETVEDLGRLPVGAGVVDYREEIALKRCEQRWNYANLSSESCGSESVMGLAPITVVYLPKTEATEIINATKKAAKTKEEMA